MLIRKSKPILAQINTNFKEKEKNMRKYQLVEKENLAYVRRYETSSPSRSHPILTCRFADLPCVKNMLFYGGTVATYKYTLTFDKGWLTIKYTWNKALYKKIWLSNVDNLISVITDAINKRQHPLKSWLKSWIKKDEEEPMT